MEITYCIWKFHGINCQTLEWWLPSIIGHQRQIQSEISGTAILFTNKCIQHRNIAFLQEMATVDLTALDSQWKYALHYNCIRILYGVYVQWGNYLNILKQAHHLIELKKTIYRSSDNKRAVINLIKITSLHLLPIYYQLVSSHIVGDLKMLL